MDYLHAPWRMRYIKRSKKGKEEKCLFCSAAEIPKPEEKLVLHRGEKGLVMMNLYPYNNGHLMIAPKRHVETIEKLNDEELKELYTLVKKSVSLLRSTLKPQGYNIGCNIGRTSGAGVPDHVHIHVVPRWVGDTNFMPVIANTKVIPEALRQTYKKLMKNSQILRQ